MALLKTHAQTSELKVQRVVPFENQDWLKYKMDIYDGCLDIRAREKLICVRKCKCCLGTEANYLDYVLMPKCK